MVHLDEVFAQVRDTVLGLARDPLTLSCVRRAYHIDALLEVFDIELTGTQLRLVDHAPPASLLTALGPWSVGGSWAAWSESPTQPTFLGVVVFERLLKVPTTCWVDLELVAAYRCPYLSPGEGALELLRRHALELTIG